VPPGPNIEPPLQSRCVQAVSSKYTVRQQKMTVTGDAADGLARRFVLEEPGTQGSGWKGIGVISSDR